MSENIENRKQAMDALLTLIGQNTFNFDALINILISKNIITDEDYDNAMENMYLEKRKEIGPAEWAKRCINAEDVVAIENFFLKGD